jgi:N,N'-diacetyllegionaminate synthase
MIVCEIGNNHFGDEEYSYKYVGDLMLTKCDAITYQIREKTFYKKNDNFKKLPMNHYSDIVDITHKNNKKFGIALADYSLIDECEKLGVDFYKVLSWDLNNYEFIDSLLETIKPIYVSTGMSSIDEIGEFCERYSRYYFTDKITLIHTQLSFDLQDVNLKAIHYLDNFSPFNVAFGSHCKNKNVLYTSIGFQPSDYFIYVKGNSKHKHPDDGHAIDISDLPTVINNMLEMELTIGEEIKIKMKNQSDKENNIK